jgi:hypothetical protein
LCIEPFINLMLKPGSAAGAQFDREWELATVCETPDAARGQSSFLNHMPDTDGPARYGNLGDHTLSPMSMETA